MKIVLAAKSVYPFHPFGGVQKYVYYFAKALARKGVELEIVAPLDGKLPRQEKYEGLTYTFLRPSIQRYLEYPIGWLGVHLFSYALARYLKNESFDLLHAFDLTGYQYVKRAPRKPVIAHIFTDNYLTNPIGLRDLSNLTASNFDKIKEEKIKISPFSGGAVKRKYLAQYLFKIKPMYACLSRCERVFIEDDSIRADMDEIFRLNSSKCDVVPVGVDVVAIQESIRHVRISRRDLGINPNDIVLITVNRLAADKGIDKIISAVDALRKNIPEIKLLVIGSGYQEQELNDIVQQKGLRGRVLFFKNVPEKDLYQYYKVSDIYISAFSFLGSSISTLEAMACALPVITTAQPWLVRGGGGNGIYLKSNDPESLADAVLKMVRGGDLKKQGELSREVVQDYAWDHIADLAMFKYKEIVSGHAQNS